MRSGKLWLPLPAWENKLKHWLQNRGQRPLHWRTSKDEPRCACCGKPLDYRDPDPKPVPRCRVHDLDVLAHVPPDLLKKGES